MLSLPSTLLHSSTLALASAFSFWGSLSLGLSKTNIVMVFTVSSTSLACPLTVLLSWDSLMFSSVVNLIASLVILFSSNYMSGETVFKKTIFYLFVMMFVLSMQMLVYSASLPLVILGWDGLGLTSFVLVIFYQNKKSLSAGMLTVLTNRLGDGGLILSISLSSSPPNNLTFLASSTLVSTLLIVAAITKSAQIPFSAWLPAAMAAPTPVSALVHSSTLVTAGVYVLYRFLFFLNPSSLKSLILMGALTMTMSSLSALSEMDAKKIVALSTLSQLGVMILALGMNLPSLAFFHLLTHALFKALLFVSLGTLIYSSKSSQDLRTLNPLLTQPLASSSFLISGSALSGLPFLSGFYSKDLIIETYTSDRPNMLILALLTLAIVLTFSYFLRLLSVLFLKEPQNSYSMKIKPLQAPFYLPILSLSSGAVLGGAILFWTLKIPESSLTLPFLMKTLPVLVLPLPLILLSKEAFYFLKINFFFSSLWLLSPLSGNPGAAQKVMVLTTLTHMSEKGWLPRTNLKELSVNLALK